MTTSASGASAAPLLDVRHLSVAFRSHHGSAHAVQDVSFSVARGETLAIVGESGSGKSVTMLALLRLLAEPPAEILGGTATFSTGDATIDMFDTKASRAGRIRGREVGYIAQDPLTSLNPTVTIGAQLSEGMKYHLGLSQTEARRRAIGLLDRVGIPDAATRLGSYPHELSGGMRQRVMIAIAISCDPKLLIADEPTTALDVTVQAQIIDLVKELRDELGLAVIWITHDLGVVAGLADRVAVMYAGRILETSPVRELFASPLHPYSAGLLTAVPRIGLRRPRLDSIPGMPPELAGVTQECSFAPRCAHAFDRCRSERPVEVSPSPGRHVVCFYDLERGAPRDG